MLVNIMIIKNMIYKLRRNLPQMPFLLQMLLNHPTNFFLKKIVVFRKRSSESPVYIKYTTKKKVKL